MIVSTVISTAVPNKAVVDAGSKTLSSDLNSINHESGFGHVPDYPQAKITRLTEEHGEIDLSQCSTRPALGERLRIIPNHICPCVNLHDSAQLLKPDGQLNLLPIDARGRLS